MPPKDTINEKMPEMGIPMSQEPYEIFDFGKALDKLRAGFHVRRCGWNGANMKLGMQHPDRFSSNTLPYIWIRTVHGDRVPWVASQTDILAHDWAEV